MNELRMHKRLAATTLGGLLAAVALVGAAPQQAAAQGGDEKCWSPMEAAVKAVDVKAAADAAKAIELEPRCNHLVGKATKVVVDVYRTLDARLEREKVSKKDQAKHIQHRLKLLEEALGFEEHAYDIHLKIADLEAKLPGKRDHSKIGMALDRALVAIDEMPEAERPPLAEIRSLAQLAYQHEALAAASGTPIQRESSFREVITRQITVGYVPAPLQFKYNEAVLTIAGERQARLLLKQLQDLKMPALKIVGHTDPVGTFEENDALSLRRAAAIKKYLEDNGYPRGRITISGRGKRDVALFESQIEKRESFTRDEIHQMLRRVELKFVD